MPTIKCPVCGHRSMPSATLKTCTNCGAALASSAPGSTSSTATPQPSHDTPPPDAQFQHFALPAPRLPVKREISLQPRPDLTPTHAANNKRVIPTRIDEEPDEDDFINIPLTTITEEKEQPKKPQPVDPPLWMIDKLPFGFPRRPPAIFGTVVNVQIQQELRSTASALGQLRDALWTVPGDVAAREKENVNVTTLRVRTNDGKQKDARMQGYQRGANISLGDTVSLWGNRRKGLLIVTKAFNHTSKAMIRTSAMASNIGFLLLLLLLVLLALLILANQYHIHIHLPLPGF